MTLKQTPTIPAHDYSAPVFYEEGATATRRGPAPTSPAQIEDQAIQLHREVADIVREEIGMHEGFANDLAAAIVRGLRKKYGGQTLGAKGSIYIPAPDKSARNAAVRAEFNGTNADEVCRKHDISRSRLYQLVGQQKR